MRPSSIVSRMLLKNGDSRQEAASTRLLGSKVSRPRSTDWPSSSRLGNRLALSAVGEQQDVDTLTHGYQEEWWLEQLARRNASAIWLRSKYPHK